MAAPMMENVCINFNLFDLYNQDLKIFLDEKVKNENVCIVSVIGKTSLNSSQFKEHIIGDTLNRHIFDNNEEDKKIQSCEVKGYYDAASHTIFLLTTAISDTTMLCNKCREMEEELKEKSFLEVWSDIHYDYAKTLLMLFCISHIIIVSHPRPSFDLSYVYLFRALDAMRLKAIPWFKELLTEVDVSAEWLQNGRPCSPRVLFVFETSPMPHINDNFSSETRSKPKKQSPLKKLEHSLEDQIYRILRKSRVITNVSGNSLFAVPANQEFVYIFSSKKYITDFVGFFLDQIKSHCQMAREMDLSDSKNKSKTSMLDTNFGFPYDSGCPYELAVGSENPEHSFSKFLFQHINLALTKGFDDNVGRYPVPAYFELVPAHLWFEVACKIGNPLMSESKDTKSRSFHQTMKATLDTDVKFSEGRCTKILPLASAAYQDNLPTHYTYEYHQTKLAHALHVLYTHARGPAVHRFANQLNDDCERLWKSGHQMCEVLSLTGNHCMNPIHRTDSDNQKEKTLPIMAHCSQVKIVSTCDCGRKQATRDDPFDVKAANQTFFATQRNHCCKDLERIEFPVFQAGLIDSHPARISPIPIPVQSEPNEEKAKDSATDSSHGNNLSKAELSEENSEESSLINEMEQLTTDEHSCQSQVEDEERDEIVISIQEDGCSRERGLTRQASTTEYLPGMLHSESKLGLLPMFSSWSLVCLGPSSLYSHNIGLQDQPGFIPGTNYLLPWDVTVKLEQKERWPALWEGKRPLSLKAKKAIRDSPQFNVKIFIGVEYECHRGHRFMCSAPDRVLRVTSTGHVKDNASKITGSDMPLYYPCPCRSSKAQPQIAQLMRIHVVTPKAPVHVTLSPQVQPAPQSCPIFFPTAGEPLKLSQSAYWVLRLPFVYEGEKGAYLPPREPRSVTDCRLLKGTYNIAEQQSNR